VANVQLRGLNTFVTARISQMESRTHVICSVLVEWNAPGGTEKVAA